MQELDKDNPQPHRVVIIESGGAEPEFRTVRTVFVDGKELLLDAGHKIAVEWTHGGSCVVLLPIMAELTLERGELYDHVWRARLPEILGEA